MDLKGSLVDTCLRIYPSETFVLFLEKQKIDDTFPINIAKFVTSENYKRKDDLENDSIPNDFQLNNSDIEKIEEIKKKLKDKSGDAEEPILKEQSNITDTPLCDNKAIRKIINLENEDNTSPKVVQNTGPYLTTADIDWLYVYIKDNRSKGENVPYLHDLLEGCQIEVPQNELIKRNPVLEARCVKLRAQQEAREYRKMTKSVDNVRMKFPEDSISYQLKQVNRQLIAIGQFILSIFAGFLFGFKGVEWLVGNLDFGFRLLLGVMCALIIALAEIYFLAKKLNEELNVPETTQLGGPPKFVDEKLNEMRTRKDVKPHQD